MREWLKSLPGRIVEGVIVGGILAAGGFWSGILTTDIALWVPAALLALLVPLAFLAGRVAGGERDLRNYYAEHVRETLDTLQRAIAGAIPGVSYSDLIERGILGPARHWLRQATNEDIRLSILCPDDDERQFRMIYEAGHTLEAREKFQITIAGSFAGVAYTRGETQWTGDVENDDRWTPHPKAHRPYGSLVCVPIKVSDRVVGVLSVLSTVKNAWSRGDLSYIELLGSVINLAWSLAEATPDEAADEHATGENGSRKANGEAGNDDTPPEGV